VRLLRNLDELPEHFRRAAVSIGNFDGVHLGHARIVERLTALARRAGTPAVVFSFDPHPAAVLRPSQAPAPLSSTERKARLLAELGADALVACPTDRALLELDPREFFQRIVLGRLGAEVLVEGSNFFFGHNRAGGIEQLRQLSADAGVQLDVVEPLRVGGDIVSSSRVRRLIAAGRLEEAAALLTQPYRIRGTVVRGAGRGASLGYPTANLGQIETLLPGEGIYAGRAWLEGACWPTAVSVGPNPTFDDRALKVELHLIGYEGVLYGRAIEVDFLARLRDITQFGTAAQLVEQMDRDVAETSRIVQRYDRAGQ
jgi:riboflavin kinase/FMN adenylyltransferase